MPGLIFCYYGELGCLASAFLPQIKWGCLLCRSLQHVCDARSAFQPLLAPMCKQHVFFWLFSIYVLARIRFA